jgi:hypothetical protein
MLPGSVDRAGPWLPRSRSRATPLRFRSFGQPGVPRGQPQSRSRVGNPPRSQPLNPALDSRPPKVRYRQAVPDPCQIVRGATGNTGDQPPARPPGADTAPLQVGPEAGLRYPQLPRLRARVSSSRIGRSGSHWSTVRAAWLRPVGVKRDIRGPGRSTPPSSWLTFFGCDSNREICRAPLLEWALRML